MISVRNPQEKTVESLQGGKSGSGRSKLPLGIPGITEARGNRKPDLPDPKDTLAEDRYAMPELYTDYDKLYGEAMQAGQKLPQLDSDYQASAKAMQETKEALSIWEAQIASLTAAYQKNPSSANANMLTQAQQAMAQVMQQYNTAKAQYDTAYGAVQNAYRDYNNAVSAFQTYYQQQNQAFDAWRGRIRAPQEIKAQEKAVLEAIKTAGSEKDKEALQLKLALLRQEFEMSEYLYYAEMSHNTDFQEMSAYKSQPNSSKRSDWDVMNDLYPDDKSGFDWTLYEAINGNEDAQWYMHHQGRTFYGPSVAGSGIYGAMTESKQEAQRMTQEEVKIFNYLYRTKGREAAQAFYDYLEGELNSRQRAYEMQYWANQAKKDPVGTSVGSILFAPVKAWSAVGQLGDLLTNGEIDPNARYNLPIYQDQAIRGQVSSLVEKKWGKAGSFAYNLGMSMADSLYAMYQGGGNSNMTVAILGSELAPSVTLSCKERGLSSEQSMALGIIAGVAEAFTEKIGLNKLFDTDTLSQSWVKYLWQNAAAEGLEEVSADVINGVADLIVSREKSEWIQDINRYKSQGMSETDAFKKVLEETALEWGLSLAGGAISGGVMGGGGIAVNNIANRFAATNQASAQAIVEAGLRAPQNTQAYQQALAALQKLQKGQTLTEAELQQLSQANAAAGITSQQTQQAQQPQQTKPETAAPTPPVDVAQDMADRLQPVQSAITEYRQSGTVSDRMADIVAGSTKAVEELEAAVDMQITGTQAQRRQAIKEAVAALVAQQEAETRRQEAGDAAYFASGEGRQRADVNAAIRQTLGVEAADPQDRQADTPEGIRKQIRDNLSELNAMEPVTEIAIPAVFAEMDLNSKIEWVIKKLRSTEYKVDRKGFGVISFAAKHLRSAFNYFKSGTVEEATFEAIPYVLENGAQIHSRDDHKGRGYGTVTFAAPVMINGQRGNMAVVVKRTTSNYYKVHRILTPDGSVFRISEKTKAEPTMAGESPVTGSLATPKGPASIGEATQTSAEGINTIHETNARSASDSPSPNDIISGKEGNVNKNSGVEGMESVGAAERGFTDWKGEYYDQLTDENSQPDRPGDVRPMEVLKRDKNGRMVTTFAGNAYGAEVTPDRMADQIQKLINDGELGFDTKSDKQVVKEAADAILAKGADTVRGQITENITKGKIQDGDIEKATLLYAAYANMESQAAQEIASGIFVDLATMANMSGRNLRLFGLLRKMTPQGQLMTVQKTIDRAVDGLNKSRSMNNQIDRVEIPQELTEAYLVAAQADATAQTAESEQVKAEIEQEIYKAAAAMMPASREEKLNAWRYMSMLGNVKTQLRNLVGNAAFRPLVNTKRAIGAAIERMTLDQENRTKAILGVGKEARALLQWAKADVKNQDAQNLLSYTARTGDTAKTAIEEARQIYDTKALEETRKFAQKVPEVADMLFKRWEYKVSLASFMKARGYTAAQLEAGSVPESVLNEGREYAAAEAMKATFNDRNAFSNALSKMRYKGRNKAGKALNILGEGIMPFRRTPANIAVRAVEYSPAGLAKGVYNLATQVKNGNMSAATAIDQIAAGLTGTGVMALGYMLASGLFGIKLVGHLDEKDERNAGRQSWAIEIGNTSFKIDWLAPANLPLFVGANIHYATEEDQQDAGWLADTFSSFALAMEPMLELSCMSGLQDLFQDAQYAESGAKIMTVVASMATSYFSQYIPTLFGQIEQATEDSKQQVYADAKTPFERLLQKEVGYASQKIPGVDLFQVDKYDQWGNPAKQKNWLDAIVNPSNISKISTDPVDKEIIRLNDAQTTADVTNKGPSNKLSYTGNDGTMHQNYTMTGKQWEVMQQTYGQTAHRVLQELIESAGYELLSEEQKAQAFGYAYEYAREAGRIAAIDDYGGYSDLWMEGIEGNEAQAIFNKVAASAIGDAFDALKHAWEYGKDTTAAVGELEAAYSIYAGLGDAQKESLLESLTGRSKYAMGAMDAGISAGDFAELYKTYSDITGDKELSTGQKAAQWAYELQKAVDNGTIDEAQRQVLSGSMRISFGGSQSADNAKIDEYIGAGVTTDQALDISELLNGIEPEEGYTAVRNVQKVEAIAGMDDLSESERVAVMKMYLGDSDDQALDRMMDAGYSAEVYATVYRAHSDSDAKHRFTDAGYSVEMYETVRQIYADAGRKKDDAIRGIMQAYGITKAAATEIYEVYTGGKTDSVIEKLAQELGITKAAARKLYEIYKGK